MSTARGRAGGFPSSVHSDGARKHSLRRDWIESNRWRRHRAARRTRQQQQRLAATAGGATLLPKGSIRRGNVRNAVAVVIQFSRFRVRILAQSYKNRQEGGGGGAGSVDVCAECISRKPTGRPRLAGWVVCVWGVGVGGRGTQENKA